MTMRERILWAFAAALVLVGGCAEEAPRVEEPSSAAERASRRAFAGAPPVIPHAPLTGTCVDCHIPTGGRVIPEVGIAPANPHTLTTGLSDHSRCRQCHVFRTTNQLFVKNDFQGIEIRSESGERAHGAAPPTVPHPLFMREDCAACHTGPAARPEIVCDHADRVRCQQCHVQGDRPLGVAFASDP